MSDQLQAYKEAILELESARRLVAKLEIKVKNFEDTLRSPASGIAQSGSTLSTEYSHLDVRFQRLIEIFQELGGRARLKDIALKTKLTTAGTLAQIRALEKLKIIRRCGHGVYEIKQKDTK